MLLTPPAPTTQTLGLLQAPQPVTLRLRGEPVALRGREASVTLYQRPCLQRVGIQAPFTPGETETECESCVSRQEGTFCLAKNLAYQGKTIIWLRLVSVRVPWSSLGRLVVHDMLGWESFQRQRTETCSEATGPGGRAPPSYRHLPVVQVSPRQRRRLRSRALPAT